MKRGSKFLIVALSTFAMAGTAVAQGDGGDTGDGTGDATGDGTGDAGTGDAGTGDAGTGDAGTGDATGGDTGGDMGGDMAADAGGGGMGPVLAKGKFMISLSLQVSLLESAIAKPFSIQPDVAYGVMPKLDVGAYHSSYGITGFWGSLGGGICVSGTDGGCAKAYNGPIGILAKYLLTDNGKMAIAADAGLVIRSTDPFALGAKVGVRGHYMAGKLMIGFAPNIQIGITKRDEVGKESIHVPVDVMFAATPKVFVGLQTGIQGPLDGFGDGYSVPVSIGAMFMATPNISAGASFNLLRVAGFEGPGAADLRSISVFASYHN
jgi:hypothetical protein